jgi:geranylgeranyl pyrophosphate synthase
MGLRDIFTPISTEMNLVEEELNRYASGLSRSFARAHGESGLLARIITHPFAIPGKRIRPALVLLCSHAVDGADRRETTVRLAAAVELLHAASLVHDDIIDGADTRRERPSLNKSFGAKLAVLTGDVLYTGFFSLIAGLDAITSEKRLSLVELFMETTETMCVGEIIAHEAGKSGNPLPLDTYLDITESKTAVLFSACCRSAGLVGGADGPALAALSGFGLDFGILFQIVDDIMDNDHGLDPGIDLGSKAREYAEKAKRRAHAFAQGPYAEKLQDLVEYVLGRLDEVP